MSSNSNIDELIIDIIKLISLIEINKAKYPGIINNQEKYDEYIANVNKLIACASRGETQILAIEYNKYENIIDILKRYFYVFQDINEIFKQEEAKRKSEEEAKRKSEEEARKKSEEEARKKSEEEARKKSEEEARKHEAITHPPYKPFLQLSIKNFKWRGNLCWMYAYLQYIYRIQCIHDLILGNNSDGNLNISLDDNRLFTIQFTEPKLTEYNTLTISERDNRPNIYNLFDNIKNIITPDTYIFKRINSGEDKNKIKFLFSKSEFINLITTPQYIIISLWFIFKYLSNDISSIRPIYNDAQSYYLFTPISSTITEDESIQEFIHVFILILAYNANHKAFNIDFDKYKSFGFIDEDLPKNPNKIIYESSDPRFIHKLLLDIFTCISDNNPNPNNLFKGISFKNSNQTCFILYKGSSGFGHYVNLIKTKDVYNKDIYIIVDSMKDDISTEFIVDKNGISIIDILNTFNTNPTIYQLQINDYSLLYGGSNSLNNSFNKYKSKYNLN